MVTAYTTGNGSTIAMTAATAHRLRVIKVMPPAMLAGSDVSARPRSMRYGIRHLLHQGGLQLRALLVRQRLERLGEGKIVGRVRLQRRHLHAVLLHLVTQCDERLDDGRICGLFRCRA